MADSKPVALSPHLWEALEQMSQEMGVGQDALVAQAVFTLARLNGYLVPGKVTSAPAASPPPTPAASSASRVPFSSGPSRVVRGGKSRMVESTPEPVPSPPPAPAYGEPGPVEEPIAPEDLDPLPPPRGKAGLTLFVSGHDPYRMPGDSFTIGRGKTCDFVIESNRVSREHCRILKEGADYVLEDLNSSNGTFFGPSKEKVSRRKIKDGDEFTLGTEKIRFQIKK
jgi:hypothetical protein